MCVNITCKDGMYMCKYIYIALLQCHCIAYLHIKFSFISSVDMELTSSGTHGAGGLEAVQGFIQDYQLLVLQEREIR
jgi:hypothetical protein